MHLGEVFPIHVELLGASFVILPRSLAKLGVHLAKYGIIRLAVGVHIGYSLNS